MRTLSTPLTMKYPAGSQRQTESQREAEGATTICPPGSKGHSPSAMTSSSSVNSSIAATLTRLGSLMQPRSLIGLGKAQRAEIAPQHDRQHPNFQVALADLAVALPVNHIHIDRSCIRKVPEAAHVRVRLLHLGFFPSYLAKDEARIAGCFGFFDTHTRTKPGKVCSDTGSDALTTTVALVSGGFMVQATRTTCNFGMEAPSPAQSYPQSWKVFPRGCFRTGETS